MMEFHCWVLELLLRQPLPNHLLYSIFLSLSLPATHSVPLRLKKTILIRGLASRPLSEPSLLSLELLHQYNSNSNTLLPLLQSAYCHVAVGSTLKLLKNGDLPGFLDAVQRIWVMRAGDLEAAEEARGLVSEGLLEWKRKMEKAARGSKGVRDELLTDWRVEAGLVAVREYLVKQLEVMGSPVLERMAQAQLEGRSWQEVLHDLFVTEEECCDARVAIEERETSDGIGRGTERTGGHVEQGELAMSSPGIDGANRNIMLEEMETSCGLDTDKKRTQCALEQRESNMISKGIDAATPSEVNEVMENLRRSCEDLKNVVEDPLPNAKEAATRVIASRLKEVMHHEEAVENHSLEQEENQINSGVKDSTFIHTGNTSVDIEPNRDPKKVSGHSIMDRNPTARTYEWEDESLESEQDNEESPSKKLCLPTPRTAKVSPLEPVKLKKVARKRKKWSQDEEDSLREGVNKYGIGNWKAILSNNRDIFQGRNAVDLKDKWRNMTRP